MKNRRFIYYLIVITGLLPFSWASGQTLLSEGQIIQMAKKDSPRGKQIEAGNQAATAQTYAVKSQFDPKLSSSYTYASSKEQAIIQFIPVFRPQKIFNLGVSQKTSLGTNITASTFSQQISTADGFINNATQVGVQLGLEIDIWKNFFGRLDRAQLRSAKLNKQVNDIQAEIDRRSFVLDIRRIYWSLIANQVSLDLSKELVKTAKTQLSESKRKLREGLGDKGDVARNQAQLSSRESSVLFFSYQKEILLSQLKAQLPSLQGQIISVNAREVIDMERKARQCMAQIASRPNVDLKQTNYDDIVSLLDEQQQNELMVANATDSIDLKLTGQYQASGVSDSHSNAYRQLDEQFLNGYQVGVAIKVPLGGELGRSREAQVSATRSRFDAQKQALSLGLKAEHEKIQKAMQLLIEASRSQAKTVESLKTSLQRTKRKYKQARVSLNTFILEQDNLFSSELQLIDTKNQILQLLLNYFKVFTNHPCQINGAQS